MDEIQANMRELFQYILSCCCGKCAPKKPDEEDEECPDVGDLAGDEETEVR